VLIGVEEGIQGGGRGRALAPSNLRATQNFRSHDRERKKDLGGKKRGRKKEGRTCLEIFRAAVVSDIVRKEEESGKKKGKEEKRGELPD